MRTNNQAIGRLLKVASNQMVREVDAFAAQFHLTGQQMLILDFLGNALESQDAAVLTAPSAVSQTMIEQEFNIRRSTTTEILQRMEKRALIIRHPSPTDARQKFVQLTDLGRQYLPEIKTFTQEHSQRVLANLSDEEVRAVTKFLNNFNKQKA
ncbi:MarR family winged helix-turn-helix transcriptional regulator [Lactococcus taiwanensis]|uniref:MarR family winged helix-turn-helix transcriptional regulator n=1 Tax=Lactococcus taiwanensis TaxID=1151742 RepID=UPI001964FDC5|nr:MarR family transcriptional regulator [Lactococcus taiwanensis]QRZ11322.1 MarR family transcriptional regulator [Lactococcus taiwanensis]